MKNLNKIIVCVATDETERTRMVQRMAVKLGLATTPGDAAKIVRQTPFDYDLSSAYFVLAGTYNFRESPGTTHRLYELAARGIAVVVGVKKLQPEFEFISTAYYQGEV